MGRSPGRGQARAQEEAARLQSSAAIQVAEINSGAALDASRIQSEAAIQAAQISASGASHAAGLVAGATSHAAGLQFRAAENSLAEQRRQYDESVERLEPYAELGEQFIGDIQQAATVEGLDARLSQILDTNAFQGLRSQQMESVNNQLGQAGLTRSGAAASAAADTDFNIASAIEQQLFGRQMNNVAIGQSAAAGQNYAGQNFANNVTAINTNAAANAGNILTQGAVAQGGFITQGANAGAQGILNAGNASANGILGAAAATAGGIQGSANATANGLVNAADARAQGRGNLLNTALSIGQGLISIGAFSDERLKENMEPIGKIKGLTLYEWDWRPVAKGLMGTEMSTGFKAQEVQKSYPDCVLNPYGVLMIDYPKLYEQLEAA